MKIFFDSDKSALEGHCKIWQSVLHCIQNFTVKSLYLHNATNVYHLQ